MFWEWLLLILIIFNFTRYLITTAKMLMQSSLCYGFRFLVGLVHIPFPHILHLTHKPHLPPSPLRHNIFLSRLHPGIPLTSFSTVVRLSDTNIKDSDITDRSHELTQLHKASWNAISIFFFLPGDPSEGA